MLNLSTTVYVDRKRMDSESITFFAPITTFATGDCFLQSPKYFVCHFSRRGNTVRFKNFRHGFIFSEAIDALENIFSKQTFLGSHVIDNKSSSELYYYVRHPVATLG